MNGKKLPFVKIHPNGFFFLKSTSPFDFWNYWNKWNHTTNRKKKANIYSKLHFKQKEQKHL